MPSFWLQEASRELRYYHFRLVGLFASCSEGENHYVESLGQTIFSVNDVLTVLAHPNITHLDKGTYVRSVCIHFKNLQLFDDNHCLDFFAQYFSTLKLAQCKSALSDCLKTLCSGMH
jgi:hypothetical protein